jgi:O-antigen/teichoic acid export membrane protein
MRQILKRLIRMVAGYGLIQWAGPFLSLLFTPLITRVLTPGDYGVADYINTVGGAIATIALFALPQAVVAHFNNHPETSWQRHITGSAFTISLVIGIVGGAGVFLAAPALAAATPLTQDYANLFRLLGATLVFSLGGAILVSAAQAALQVRWGMILSVTAVVCTVFGNVFFILVLRLGVVGMLLTPATLSVATFLVALILTRRMIGPPVRAVANRLLRTGATLLPSTLAAWGLLVADRLILAQYVSAEQLGFYAIANKIASLLYVMIAPLFAAYVPLALSLQNDPLAKQRYASLARYIIGAVLFASLALGLYATEILAVLTRTAYLPAAKYVGLLSYMHVFGAIYTVLSTGSLAGKRFAAITWTSIIGVGVNLALNFWLIPIWGVWGATIATFLSYAVSPVLLYFWLRRRYPIPYPAARITLAVLVQIGLLALGQLIPAQAFLIDVAIKLLLLLSLPIAFILLRIITPYEVEQGLLFIRVRLPRRNTPVKK